MIDHKHIGRTTPPQTFDVEKGRLKFFAKAIGETDPVYSDEEAAKAAGYASIPAPPTFGFCLEMESNSLWDNIAAMGVPVGKILHGSQTFTYHAPVCAGGNGTLVGASANLAVAGLAEHAGIRFVFVEFAKIAFPVMLVTVFIAMIYVELRYL